MKKCQYCAEEIQDAAIVCRYCGRDLVKKKRRWWVWLLWFLVGLIWFVVCSITIGVMRDGYLGDYPVFPGIAGVSIATEVKKEVLPTKTNVPSVLSVTQTTIPTSTNIKIEAIPSPTMGQADSFEACVERGVMSYVVTSDGGKFVEITLINDKGKWQKKGSYLPWCLSYDTWTGGRMYLYVTELPPGHYPPLSSWVDDEGKVHFKVPENLEDAPFYCDIYYQGENVAHGSSFSPTGSATCIYEK